MSENKGFTPTNFSVDGEKVGAKPSFLPEINIKVKELPSKALPYPDDCEIKYRPYTYGEVKQISQSSKSMADIYKTLLAGIECVGFEKEDLTLPDALFIGVLRKISTLGTTEIFIPYKCPKCGNTGKHIMKTDELDFNELEIPDLPIRAKLKINDGEEKDFHFMPITVRQFMEVYKTDDHRDEVKMLSKCCTNVDQEEAYNYFFHCTPENGRLLVKIDEYMNHGLKPVEITCSDKHSDKKEGDNKAKACGHKMGIELDGGQAIILPFRRRKESTGSTIHFGKES